MKMQIFSFSFTLIFLAAYTMQGFEHSAHLTVNIMLAAFCLAGLNGILWPQCFNFLNEKFLDLPGLLSGKLPGNAYNQCRQLRVLGLASALII